MSVPKHELRERDYQVLRQIVSFHRNTKKPVEASTLSDVFEWADRGNGNQKMCYRLKKLGRHDLVETWRAEERAAGNRLAPRVARPTNEGIETYENRFGEDGVQLNTLPERVQRIEKQLSVIRETYGEMKDRVVELEEEIKEMQDAIEEYDSELDDLHSNLNAVQKRTEDVREVAEQFGH